MGLTRGGIDGLGLGRVKQHRPPHGEQARQVWEGKCGPFGWGDASVSQSGQRLARSNDSLFD
jgi:hypothetical protein